VIQILVVFLISYLTLLFLKKLYHKLLPVVKASAKIWDDALLIAAYRPLRYFVWMISFILVIEIINYEVVKIPFFDKFPMVFKGLTVAIFSSFFLKFGKHFELIYLQKNASYMHVDRTTIRAIFNLFQGFVILLSILSFLQVFGVPLSGVVAFGGVGGIAVGFASKDLLANFFGGLMIFLDRPFVIGEWIRSPDKEIEGTVEHIGWRQVMIRNLEQRPIYVPNSLFSTIIIENPSRMQNRRIRQTIGIRYQDIDKLSAISKSIEKYLKESPEIDQNKHILVALINPSSYALDILIEAFTKATSKVHYYQVQHAVFVQILSIIESYGAQSPYPTQSIILENTQVVQQHVENKLQ
jgi:MscS family membrane protein